MRHVWPVLAGAAERFRRYAPGLNARGMRMSAFARLPDPGLPILETAPGGVEIHRVPGPPEDVHAWDRALYVDLWRYRAAYPKQSMILQTNVAFLHTRSAIQHLRETGVPTVWLGSMMEDMRPGMSWWRVLRERLRLRHMFAVFDACTVGSNAMADWLSSSWVP